ncbi:Tripartite tricarboxylate transporter family receptor [compost metagenome]|jgi:tripartite-type tricarboxylate transporter receptor subunit TctC
MFNRLNVARASLSVVAATMLCAPAFAWEPTKAVEMVLPSGSGSGTDQMARLMSSIVVKHSLAKKPYIVTPKGGAGGAEGFIDLKTSPGNPHKILISASHMYMLPLTADVPFTWKDMTPVANLVMDEFILWVNAASPYKTAGELLAAAKAKPGQIRAGGAGSKREDNLLFAAVEQAAGVKFNYIPYKGGGDVATQLVGNHIDVSVNNPVEAVSQWRAGQLRPLCVFDDKPMAQTDKVTATESWSSIPTCKSAGLNVTYLMQRSVFLPTGVKPDQVAYYVDQMQKIVATPEWKEFSNRNAFKDAFMTGPTLQKFLQTDADMHYDLLKKAGFLAAPQ